MAKRIVIVGVGFAGLWSALAAKRLASLTKKEDKIEVLVIAPEPSLVIRPRLYETNPAALAHPLSSLFADTGIQFIQGVVETIHPETHIVHVRSPAGVESKVGYDRLILAAGSSVVKPKEITGLEQYAFDIDSQDSAIKLEAHLVKLSSFPSSPARDTVVVCGAGFTGIEVAAELPKRLDHIPNARVILIEKSGEVGASLGPGPRPIISQALEELGIVAKHGSGVASIDPEGVTLASGEHIKTKTVIWTAGVRATSLTQQIPGDKDTLSRLHVDQNLRVPSADGIYATGDAASVYTDDKGHYALMSCQHALQLGRVSGHNAAAELLGEPLVNYKQSAYITCLDLGSWGAVLTAGWERKPKIAGDLAKRVKGYINQKIIYPPENAQEALIWANPIEPDGDQFFKQIVEAVI